MRSRCHLPGEDVGKAAGAVRKESHPQNAKQMLTTSRSLVTAEPLPQRRSSLVQPPIVSALHLLGEDRRASRYGHLSDIRPAASGAYRKRQASQRAIDGDSSIHLIFHARTGGATLASRLRCGQPPNFAAAPPLPPTDPTPQEVLLPYIPPPDDSWTFGLDATANAITPSSAWHFRNRRSLPAR